MGYNMLKYIRKYHRFWNRCGTIWKNFEYQSFFQSTLKSKMLFFDIIKLYILANFIIYVAQSHLGLELNENFFGMEIEFSLCGRRKLGVLLLFWFSSKKSTYEESVEPFDNIHKAPWWLASRKIRPIRSSVCQFLQIPTKEDLTHISTNAFNYFSKKIIMSDFGWSLLWIP